MTPTPKGAIPERVFAALTILPTALVCYLATRILFPVPGDVLRASGRVSGFWWHSRKPYASPGNFLAFACLMLAGLVLGGFVRRYGLRSPVTVAALVAVLGAVLLAIMLR